MILEDASSVLSPVGPRHCGESRDEREALIKAASGAKKKPRTGKRVVSKKLDPQTLSFLSRGLLYEVETLV